MKRYSARATTTGRRLVRALLISGLMSLGGVASATDDPHAPVFKENPLPSATQCAACHPRIYAEWASSNHAYASISPMFHKFEQRISDLTNGTIGTFCVRCHQQAGTQNGEPRELAVWDRSPVSREGVTCVTCHRVKAEFGKVNGERHLITGDLSNPVYNVGRGGNLETVQQNPEDYGLKSPLNGEGGDGIHSEVIKFEQIGRSEFCVSCHQVAVNLGIKLEVVWDQYRASPAADHGITCQDCHMGKVPGRADGYDTGHIAIVRGRPVGDGTQRHSNHAFYGPGYPIAHPGIFPFNPRAQRWSIEQWLEFDYRSGWGERDWEDQHAASTEFPETWGAREDREAARIVVNQNQNALEYKRKHRRAVMENGSQIDGPFFASEPRAGKPLKFRYRVTNTDEGHNLPSGSLGAQPEIWLNVALVGPDGENVWESGYVDSAGDMADLHSADVLAGTLPHDDQLFNLQTKFLTTNIKGTDREMYLPGELRRRPDPVPASGQRADHGAEPPAGRAHGGPQHPAAGLPRRQLHGARRRDEQAGHLQARGTNAITGRTDLLHEVRVRDAGNGAGDQRMDDRHPPLCRRIRGEVR